MLIVIYLKILHFLSSIIAHTEIFVANACQQSLRKVRITETETKRFHLLKVKAIRA